VRSEKGKKRVGRHTATCHSSPVTCHLLLLTPHSSLLMVPGGAPGLQGFHITPVGRVFRINRR
jgi:hypothetical protein